MRGPGGRAWRDLVTSVPTRTLAVAVAVSVGLGAGALIGARRLDGVRAEVRSLRASVTAVASQAASVRSERNRLRAERNQLEARLAAERAPAVCPQEYVSTSASGLGPYFSVDYPCGWHVVRDARPNGTATSRPGMRVELMFFSRLPIALAPRSAPIADVELADWTDDPATEGDALPPIDQWLAEERARFSAAPRETSFEGGGGVTIHRLEGAQPIGGEDAPVVVMLWEFDDTVSGAHHVARAFALAPGAKAREALDRMARSFGVPSR